MAVSFVTPSPKKGNKVGDGFIDEEPFIDKRKQLSTTVEKSNLNKGEHTLIQVTMKMVHSAVSECKRLVLKDSQPFFKKQF